MASITTSTNLDVNGLVTQLMAAERQPLTKLQSRVNSASSDISLYGTVRSELSSLESAARALGGTNALSVYSAALSDGTIGTVTASSIASAGQYSVKVTQLASSQTLVGPRKSDSTERYSGDLTFTAANSSAEPNNFIVKVVGKSLTGVRDAINSATNNFGVSASVINDGTGNRLVLRSTQPGADNAITQIEASEASEASNTDTNLSFLVFGGTHGTPTYSEDSGNPGVIRQSVAASDAEIVVDGVTITSSTNLFTDAIPGVTFNALARSSSPVTLSITRDDSAVAKKAQTFVDAYNTFMTNNSGRYAKGGALEADGSILTMMNGLRSLLSNSGGSDANYKYLFQLGISVTKTGTLTFDSSTFKQGLASNPSAVSSLLSELMTSTTNGSYASIAFSYQSSSGVVQSRTDGLNSRKTRLNDQIDQFNARLTRIEARYRNQFSKLDALMGSMQQTSAALTNALKTLPGFGS
jgi:flagellar hook-associated protein 2